VTLAQTNTYFVGSPSQATVTLQDSDAAANIVAVASLNAPVGIDYHPTTNSLIDSMNLSQQSVGGEPVNFARVDPNGTSNAWSTLHGMGFADDEIKLAIVKVTTNGWTQGDMYFGTAQVGKIGKITANGSSVNTNWATLAGETNFLGGSLYFDQTPERKLDSASSQAFTGNRFTGTASTAGLRTFILHPSGVFLRCVPQLKPWHRALALEFFLGQACSPVFGFFAAR
jgi:hypothetical protein